MKYITLFAAMAIAIASHAQDCNKEALRQKPGTWKAGMKGSIVNVTPADLAKEKAVLGNIHSMISSSYKPTGCEITYATVFGKSIVDGTTWYADPYYYSMYILRYLCDPNNKSKSYVDAATPTTVNITANVINALYLNATELPPDDMRGYLKLKQRPQKKDGVWFMGEEVVGDDRLPSEIKEYRWLITYGDTLPFAYVSRKEYLLIQKKRLEKSMKESPSEQKYLTQFVNNVNEYLKKPEADLRQPAICMWNDEERFEKFVEEGTPYSFIAVKPNLAYYHKKLPKSSPQFFTVVYKISKGDPVFLDNYEAIKRAIDFTKLKNMLGK